MKRLILLIVLTLVVLAGLITADRATQPVSDTDRQTMQVAANLYANAQYVDAARLYQQLVDQGLDNAALYYNLANAYAQAGDTGRAILNYSRAERLAPRDADIRANLAAVLKQAGLQQDALARSPLERLVDGVQSLFTTNELALLVLAAWFGILLFAWLRPALEVRLMRRLASGALLLSLVVLVVGGVALGAILYREQTEPVAVVVAPVSVSGEDLQAGTEVQVVDQRGDQLHVSLPDSAAEGWVAADSVEVI